MLAARVFRADTRAQKGEERDEQQQREQLSRLLDLSSKGISELIGLQRKALR
jgi:ribonuclease PH